MADATRNRVLEREIEDRIENHLSSEVDFKITSKLWFSQTLFLEEWGVNEERKTSCG